MPRWRGKFTQSGPVAKHLAWHGVCSTKGMTEPLYTYRKGEGWLPQIEVTAIAYSCDKTKKITITKGMPKDGQAFVIGLDAWTIEDIVYHVSGFEWENYMPFNSKLPFFSAGEPNIFALVIEPNDRTNLSVR